MKRDNFTAQAYSFSHVAFYRATMGLCLLSYVFVAVPVIHLKLQHPFLSGISTLHILVLLLTYAAYVKLKKFAYKIEIDYDSETFAFNFLLGGIKKFPFSQISEIKYSHLATFNFKKCKVTYPAWPTRIFEEFKYFETKYLTTR